MTVYKYPFEQFAISIDFAGQLGNGGGIASVSGVTAVNDLSKANSTSEVIMAEPAPAISGTEVTFTITGGVPGETHTISTQIVSTAGARYQ